MVVLEMGSLFAHELHSGGLSEQNCVDIMFLHWIQIKIFFENMQMSFLNLQGDLKKTFWPINNNAGDAYFLTQVFRDPLSDKS